MPARLCNSRSLSEHPRRPLQQHRRPPFRKSLIISVSVAGTALVVLLFLFLWYLWSRKSSKSRDVQTHPPSQAAGSLRKLQKFSYKELKKATKRFDETQKLGKGGYGVVYRGLLKNGEEVAVKKLVLSSLQGEREFQNELAICRRLESRYVVKLLGFATHGEKVRLLVYECMQNRSLQEALLEKHTSVHLNWGRRFNIILDIARAIAYLHLECRPPVVHGDVKPSNVLLDGDFHGCLADFGLARLKVEDQKPDQLPEASKSDVIEMDIGTPKSSVTMKSKSFEVVWEERKQSKLSEERVMGGLGDQSLPSSYIGSPHSGVRCSSDMRMEVETPGSTSVVPLNNLPDQSPGDKILTIADSSQISMQHEELANQLADSPGTEQARASVLAQEVSSKPSGKDNWWWKQETSGELKVRDYVMEWMRSELSTEEKHKGVHSLQQSGQQQATEEGKQEATAKKREKQEQRKRRVKVTEEARQKEIVQAKRNESAKARVTGKKGREWWKDEYFAELSKKGAGTHTSNRSMTTRGNDGSVISVDRSRLRDVTGLSSLRMRGDSAGGDTAASDDLSSTTTSMRGTVCYVAPEFGGVGVLSEASDIYSFGVLLLVIISGRRPIEITTSTTKTTVLAPSVGASPTVRRFERANLITWARNLAYSGNVFDLVDDRLHGAYPREQVQLCISLALLCIRRLPSARPNIASVVKILLGEAPLPLLPVEFSPSPPSRLSVHQSPRGAAASFVSSSDDLA